MIEWTKRQEVYDGLVGGLLFADIHFNKGRSLFMLDFHHEHSFHKTLEAAKLKAESLLAEWDKKRGIMKIPEFCDKCGDSGIVVSSDSWGKRSKPYTTCSCATNPNAWVNVKQTIGGKG